MINKKFKNDNLRFFFVFNTVNIIILSAYKMKLLNVLLIFSLSLFALFYNTQSFLTNVVNDLDINPDPKMVASLNFDSKTLIDPNKVHESSVKP